MKVEPNYFNIYMKDALKYTAGMGGMNVMGMQSPNAAFTAMSTILVSAAFVVITQFGRWCQPYIPH